METAIGIIGGAIAGFFYWKFIGCGKSYCSITGNKYNSMLYGAIIGLLLISSGCTKQKSAMEDKQPAPKVATIQQDHRLDNAAFAEKMKDSSAVVLDVRTPAEFQAGHLERAVNINVNDPAFADRINSLDKNATYLIYCKSGARSEKAYEYMKQSGFSQLFTLPTGIVSWDGEIVK